MKIAVIACEVMGEEIKYTLKKAQLECDLYTLKSSLHIYPEELNKALQHQIDEITDADIIYLAYGKCGGGAIGLHSKVCPIVMPRTSDCIDTLLHSNPDLPLRRADSFFISKGWQNFITEQENLHYAKYTQKRASELKKLIYKNYTYIAYMQDANINDEHSFTWAKEYADSCGLELKTIDTNTELLDDMLKGIYDSRHIMVQKNEFITENMFKDSL